MQVDIAIGDVAVALFSLLGGFDAHNAAPDRDFDLGRRPRRGHELNNDDKKTQSESAPEFSVGKTIDEHAGIGPEEVEVHEVTRGSQLQRRSLGSLSPQVPQFISQARLNTISSAQ